MFGLESEKAFRPGWTEGREEREHVEVEALGGRESRREGWAEYREALLRREMFLHSKWTMLRTATLSELRLMCSLKTFPSSPGSALTYTSVSMTLFTPAIFVLGLT